MTKFQTSDPLSYTCTCMCSQPQQIPGQILLFYRYFSQPPQLPQEHNHHAEEPALLAEFHRCLSLRLQIGGKIRIAKEGFNITVGGTDANVREYIKELLSHWSFQGLDLDTIDKQNAFFKPTPGCACAFGGSTARISVKDEITPMGVTNFIPTIEDWKAVSYLEPWEWHDLLSQGDESAGSERFLIDVRNHYESRIGYFIDPRTGEIATRPGIRRFSQFPGYARKHFGQAGIRNSTTLEGVTNQPAELAANRRHSPQGPTMSKEIFTYCTGGIRCEKATRWMVSNTSINAYDVVFTLKGGIAAYLTWMDAEIAAGHRDRSESLFKGRNYVFDARGSLSLQDSQEKVSICDVCGKSEDRLSKCGTPGCHLVLVVCEDCEVKSIKCCESCEEGSKGVCECERRREQHLWGGRGQVKISQGKNPRRKVQNLDKDGKISSTDIMDTNMVLNGQTVD